MEDLKKKIIDELREVYDPEIPINVYDLGLIYEININESNHVHILMTLTSPTCPTADFIKEMVQDAIKNIEGVKSIELELTFDPLWSPDRVSLEVKEELGLMDSNMEDLNLQNTFSPNISNESLSMEKICFNCGCSSENKLLLEAFYKGEKIKICTKCINKF